jgi:GNAT superfamily N-acetyltransferase
MKDLEFVARRRGPDDDRYRWVPFDHDDRYEQDDWWDSPPYGQDDPWFVQVMSDGEEVARVELDETWSGSHHEGAPKFGREVLVVRQIEVAEPYRRQGIGSRVVAGLIAAHPYRRFIALSMDADEFWTSVGWERFDDLSRGPFHPGKPLFVQPDSGI